MDPFLQYQQTLQQRQIYGRIANILAQMNPGEENNINQFFQQNNDVQDLQQEIQNFTFVVLEHDMHAILATAPYVNPKPHRHYRIKMGKNFINTNIQGLQYNDPEAAGIEAMAGAPDQQAANQAFENARRQTVVNNEAARRLPPVWELCIRTEMNDTRLEDTLIVSVPDGSRKVDWYQTVRKIKQAGENFRIYPRTLFSVHREISRPL